MKSVARLLRVTLVVGLTAAWLMCAPAPALAQAPAPGPAKAVSGLGYGFFGVGAATCCGDSTGTWHAGGGGEAVIGDAVGIGAEIGYLNLVESGSDGLGVFSVNGAYHFFPGQPSHRVRPFVTGGYTLGFASDGHENLLNFGGGVDYWLKPKVGLRVEFRDHVWGEEGDTLHFWSVRFGVTFK